MKLILHTPDSHIHLRGVQDARIRLNRKSGGISMNIFTANQCGIKPDDKVILVQNAEKPKDWYLTKSPDGFPMKQSASSRSLVLTNKSLVKAIMDSTGTLDNTISWRIGGQWIDQDGFRLWPIVTAQK